MGYIISGFQLAAQACLRPWIWFDAYMQGKEPEEGIDFKCFWIVYPNIQEVETSDIIINLVLIRYSE